MKFLNVLAALSLVLFIGCGGGSSEQQTESAQPQEQETETASDVRTIDIVGIDQMKFVVAEDAEGISVGDQVGNNNMLLLETITAQPGEEIRIRLKTESTLPASAMAHNWLLLAMGVDAQEFANAAVQAKDNDYVPADRQDQILAQTGLAAGGETVEVTFTAPEETGDYDYICSFPGHFAAGMKGVLNVEGSSGSDT